ncbi:oxidoreductase, zinc-binding dehydrogenase family [Hyphomonas neptunium ATCC 15444]|uniref:Oxidoreductase, zinc-binding dehydrogenase family n=2 Tax=Hyphomonas TaxID=85 RepID=Q0BZC8_HYPNA|nr:MULTISPECIES: NADP-dependent oxidoreductase [Hyphomonas]ABI78850.1 oxidoreductase, zinc-binding dehydrogenase family [Hyphomonas neptunium ATCC 15444]
MPVRINPHWILARTPIKGWPVDEDFSWREAPAILPQLGQMLTRTIYLSLDPYQWGRRRRGVEIPGEVCHGRTVSQVLQSRIKGFEAGDYVFNTNGWQTYGLTGEGISDFGYMLPRKIDPNMAPISSALGILGMLGLTAYAGIVVQCAPQPGETVVISAASGGVGQVAGQLAKLRGCRVVGIAGREEKCAYVRDTLGLDACISHLDSDFSERLRAACPDGVDVYFENVGGRVFEAVLNLFNINARITLCGLASQYGAMNEDIMQVWNETGADIFSRRNVIVHPLFVGNFVVSHQDQFLAEMAEWLRGGHMHYLEDISDGLESAPQAFREMLAGGTFGKTLVQVSADPTL